MVGYPIWNGYLPNIVINQLEKLNLNGKTIYPFNTHESSGVAKSIDDIKDASSGATIKDGFPISQSNIQNKDSSLEQIKKWVNDNNFQETSEQTNDIETTLVTDSYNISSKLNLFTKNEII